MLITLPYKILVDKDVSGKVAGTLESLNFGRNCAVLCTDHMKKICGNIVEEISSSFTVDFVEFSSCESSHLKDLAVDVKASDFIIGIGGGKTMDAAKYLSHVASKPWVAAPTILSHDGVVSSRAVLDDNGSKISVDAVEPSAIIADLGTISKADRKYIMSGVGDLISNLSAVEDWKIADAAGKEKYHEMMARLSLISAEAVIKHIDIIKKKEYHGLEILFWSLVSSGFAMNIYGSSRPCSGSEHNISHALDKMGSEELHGAQVALCTIVSTYLQKGDWENVRNIVKEAGLPITAKEMGNSDRMIDALVAARGMRSRYTILNKHKFTKQSAEGVLKETGII